MDNSLKIISLRPDSITVANHILTSANGWRPGKALTTLTEATPVTLPTGQPVGIVDWSTAKADDAGLWVKRILARRSQYVKMLERLLERGLVTTRPICEAGKAAGNIAICKDVLITPAEATKAIDWQTSLIARALGLSRPQTSPQALMLQRLQLKLKVTELAMPELF